MTFVAFLIVTTALATRGQDKPQTTAYDAYCGDYRVAPDHMVGIDLYITEDTGEHTLLFSDYQSGVVRRLYSISETEFAMGPGFSTPSPVELRVRFVKDDQGAVTGIYLHPTGESEGFADRAPTKEEEVTFHNGDVKLAGTLIIPRSKGPHPAIILLHGSGPLNRNSFGPYPHFFASFGFAVLTYDKRSTGASTGVLEDPATYYPDDLTKDAEAAFRFLESHEDINPREIGFWGASEGGMLTTQLAARSKDVAFIINSSGFMMPLWQQVLYHVRAKLLANGFSKSDAEEAVAFTKLRLSVAKTGKGWEQFLKTQEQVRDKKWFAASSEVITSEKDLRWNWTHELLFSPLPDLRKVTCPVLGVFGELDDSTPAFIAVKNMRRQLTEAGNKDFTLKIFAKANHPLMESHTGGSEEFGSLKRMAPGVFDTLRSWLLKRVHVPNEAT